jgi:hypothetical protein
LEPLAIATNESPLLAIPHQFRAAGIVREVQVIPSGEVAAVVALNVVAQKTEPFQAMACQFADADKVRAVQVIPSGEVAALFEP